MLWRRLRMSQALRQPQEAWIQADSGGHRVLFDATPGEALSASSSRHRVGFDRQGRKRQRG